jgi:hypothetical protein
MKSGFRVLDILPGWIFHPGLKVTRLTQLSCAISTKNKSTLDFSALSHIDSSFEFTKICSPLAFKMRNLLFEFVVNNFFLEG